MNIDYWQNTGWGKSSFIVVSMQNTEFILVLLFIIVLLSIGTIVNLHLPHPVYFQRKDTNVGNNMDSLQSNFPPTISFNLSLTQNIVLWTNCYSQDAKTEV